MVNVHVIVGLLIAVTASCHARPDTIPQGSTRDGDAYVDLAIEADHDYFTAPPSMATAERHALRLAELSRKANATRPGSRHVAGATRLAIVADAVRDELLACRRPRWVPRLPPLRPGDAVATANWLEVHKSELRVGIEEGFVASRPELEEMIAWIDVFVADRGVRDGDLYLLPPLRRYRDFLDREVVAHASPTPGLVGLPTGVACLDATGHLHAARAWDADHASRIAAEILETTPLPGDPDHVLDVLTSERPAQIWRPNAAIERGLALHREIDASHATQLIVAIAAVGATLDLRLHREGLTREQAQTMVMQLPWLQPSTIDALYTYAGKHPLELAAGLIGYGRIATLCADFASEYSRDEVLGVARRIGALPPHLFETELRDALRLRRTD